MIMPVDSVLDCLLIPEEKTQKMLLLTELDPLKWGPDGIYLILRGLKLCFRSIPWLWLWHFCNLQHKIAWNFDFHGFRGCCFGNMASLRWSFISRHVLMVDPPKFQIAAIRKRNGVRVSNFQDFLVSVISTSMLNKKKIHDIGCTPPVWVGLEWPYFFFSTLSVFCLQMFNFDSLWKY